MERKYETTDELLLQRFFSEHRQPLAADGFVERVMQALPEAQTAWAEENRRLRHWSAGLNMLAAVAAAGLLFSLDFFGSVRIALQTWAGRLLAGILSLDSDDLLVQLMLLLRRLPELLPSPLQLAAIVLASLVLLPLCIQKIAKEV